MTELQELTHGKCFDELQIELDFQTNKMGESLGGAICSEIVARIESLIGEMPKDELNEIYLDYFNNYLSYDKWSLDHGFTEYVGGLILNRGRKINHGEIV